MSLPSSMADFVPCDCLLQKAYCLITFDTGNYSIFDNLLSLMGLSSQFGKIENKTRTEATNP